jgi:hypothetical protein
MSNSDDAKATKKSDNNPLLDAIKKHGNSDIKPGTQQMLNKPLAEKMDEADTVFLQDVIAKVESGEIDLLAPASILNAGIYENLDTQKGQKVDLTLHSLLFNLRQIMSWHQAGERENSQTANMIHDIRLKKEKLEAEVGDVLKI